MNGKVTDLNPVRLGIVGLGSMGAYHARAILQGEVPGCVLAAVCDTVREKLAAFPGVPAFTDCEELIRSGQVDAILVATPHYSHTPIGIQVLKAGLHLLVEKPISVHKADCERLLAAHTNSKQVFAVMFNQRTDPFYQTMRRMVRGGELGRIHRYHWTITDWFRSQAYYNSSSWRATWAGEGGGVLLNQGVHNIDLMQWIFGMPEKVHAVCRLGRYHDIEVEDEVSAIFEYNDGTTGTFVTSTGESPGVNHLEIVGDRGRLVQEDGKLRFLRNHKPSSEYIQTTIEGYVPPSVEEVVIDLPNRGEQHKGILRNFVRAIREGEPLLSPATDGIHSVELINAMLLSSFQNRTVVLPIAAAEYERQLQDLIEKSRFNKTVAPYRGGAGNYLEPS